jgi:hypothetical protein
MSIFQLGAMLFAIFMLYVVYLHHKRGALSFLEASFWYSLWALFILLSMFPDLLLGIAGALRFSRVFDLLVVVGMMVISVVVFLTYFSQKASMKKIEEFIRKLAIKNMGDKA